MPAQSKPVTRKQILDQLLTETYQVAVGQFPDIANYLPLKQPQSGLLAKLKPSSNQQAAKIKVTEEEYQATLQGVIQLINQPPKNYQDENLLYLEQQLSELLGFTLSATHQGYQIPYIGGVMAALPHLKRTPIDELEQHQSILEAGMKQRRSFYGWFSPHSLDETQIEAEKFYFSLPINLTPAWSNDPKTTAEWFKHRQMVMINPSRQLAVVGVLADIGPYNPVRAQFGGSPEVTRLGQVWHPDAKGKVAIFFVTAEKEVPLGLIRLNQKLNSYV